MCSIGEYWVPASTATYRFGAGDEGAIAGAGAGEWECRRDLATAGTREECRGDGAGA
jgi:hypothetical protein